jgi:hypothetical protein
MGSRPFGYRVAFLHTFWTSQAGREERAAARDGGRGGPILSMHGPPHNFEILFTILYN